MKLEKNEKWTSSKYEKLRQYLRSIREEKIKKFNEKLIFTKYEILGIRIPVLRTIAKEIAKTDIVSFLSCSKTSYYEEILIQGFLVAAMKDKEIFLPLLEEHIKKIDNWALCDTFCNSLTLVAQTKKDYFTLFSSYTKREEPYFIRVGLITILSFYIEEAYLTQIFELTDQLESEEYYVNMAIAWLLSICYIKYKEKTAAYLATAKLNNFVYNKTLQKIIESKRIDEETKKVLRSQKRRNPDEKKQTV